MDRYLPSRFHPREVCTSASVVSDSADNSRPREHSSCYGGPNARRVTKHRWRGARYRNWTKWLAVSTGAMAAATSMAVILPLALRAYERRRRRRVALGQLHQILRFFMDRTSLLNAFPTENARSLFYGLDSALTRALAHDIGDALAPADADDIYGALISAHGAIARAIEQQRQALEEPPLSDDIGESIKEDTGAAVEDLTSAQRLPDGLL